MVVLLLVYFALHGVVCFSHLKVTVAEAVHPLMGFYRVVSYGCEEICGINFYVLWRDSMSCALGQKQLRWGWPYRRFVCVNSSWFLVWWIRKQVRTQTLTPPSFMGCRPTHQKSRATTMHINQKKWERLLQMESSELAGMWIHLKHPNIRVTLKVLVQHHGQHTRQ